MRAALTTLAALLVASSARAADGAPRRFAIVSGASEGGPTRTTLRYSASDARQVARVLRRLGGVALDDLLLVEEPDAPALRAALAKVAAETGRAREAGQRVELFLYFSGHSDENGLLLGKTQVSYSELRAELQRVPADVRVAILDSCSSGAITRAKGGVHRPPFLLDASSNVKGHAFLTSSAADEASQESDRLQGSFFTHALLTGLRGGADAGNDGVVTLNEAYQFAFRETLARTETTQGGAQHATYDIGLVGSGDVVMTDLRRADAALVIPASLEGTVFVRNAAGQLVAELRKVRGAGVELALEEGRYDVRVSLDRNVTSTTVDLVSSARVVLDAAMLAPTPLEATALRGEAAGAGGARLAALPAPGPPAPVPASDRGAAPARFSVQTGPAWATFTTGTFVTQVDYRGTFGWDVRAAAGTWIWDVVGIEGAIGFSRLTAQNADSRLPATTTGGISFSGGYGPFPCRETLSIVPVEATLRLGLPSTPFRPYLLVGAGLWFVRLQRVLTGPSSYALSPWGDTITATEDHLTATDVLVATHAGLGAFITLSPRLQAVVEARYQIAQPKFRDGSTGIGSPNLKSARVSAGFGYAF